jgi:Zn-dependent protease with chaperone function
MRMKRFNINLIFFSSILIFLLSLFVIFVDKFSPIIGHATYFCRSFIETYMIQVPSYLGILPYALTSLLLFMSIIKVFFLIIKIRFLKNSLNRNQLSSALMGKVLRDLHLEEKTVLVNSEERFAFCLGIKSTRIYISKGLINFLTKSEIIAVLMHENYHLEKKDTLIMTLAYITNSLFPFLPMFADLMKKYKIDREICADRFAAEMLGEEKSLVSALKKLLINPTLQVSPLVALADQDSLYPRIHALTKKNYKRTNFRKKNILITFLFMTFITISLALPVQAREYHNEEQDILMVCANGKCVNSCTNKENFKELYSNISDSTYAMTPVRFTPAK